MKKIELLLRICLALLLAFLLLIVVFTTGVNQYLDSESVYFKNDNIIWNMISSICFIALVIIMASFLDKIRYSDYIVIVAMIFTCLMCISWVKNNPVRPDADQKLIWQFACAFNGGDFSGLAKTNYVGLCQHQLGIITYARILAAIFHNDYRAFQYTNAVWITVMLFAGYKFTACISKDKKVHMGYVLLFMTYIPLYVYCSFVYGEIPSIAMCMLVAYIYMKILTNFAWYRLLWLGGCMGIAVLLRENSIILAIAIVLLCLVKMISYIRLRQSIKKEVLIMLSIVLGVGLLRAGLYHGIYKTVIPEDSHSMPSLLYIAMGTTYNYRNPGVYNSYNMVTFMDSNYDVEVATEAAQNTILDFLSYCRSNKDYAIEFVYNKIRCQWNVPLQLCFVMNRRFEGNQTLISQFFYTGMGQLILEKLMEIWQIAVYFLVFVYNIRNKKKIDDKVLLITIFGGFFFSILWEAKARYVLPYIIMMIPYAACGLEPLLGRRKTLG